MKEIKLAVIGHPLKASMSPVMYEEIFSWLGDAVVDYPLDILPEQLGDTVRRLIDEGYDGFNITMPYKLDIMRCLESVDPMAEAIGAVNTVTIQNGRLRGYNTDGAGFVDGLKALGCTLAGKRVLLLGAGGAARSMGFAFAGEQPQKLFIYNRTEAKAADLCARINAYYKREVACVLAKPDVSRADIIANATSTGMLPDTGNLLAGQQLGADQWVADAVYKPAETPMIRMARAAGCRTMAGIHMLMWQGVRNVRIWQGEAFPVRAAQAASLLARLEAAMAAR
nr:shikimate dehydrogenase [Maliibacterium massiliense]